MPRPASTEAGQAGQRRDGQARQADQQRTDRQIQRRAAVGQAADQRDTSRPAAISATVTAPSRLPAATGVQPSACAGRQPGQHQRVAPVPRPKKWPAARRGARARRRRLRHARRPRRWRRAPSSQRDQGGHGPGRQRQGQRLLARYQRRGDAGDGRAAHDGGRIEPHHAAAGSREACLDVARQQGLARWRCPGRPRRRWPTARRYDPPPAGAGGDGDHGQPQQHAQALAQQQRALSAPMPMTKTGRAVIRPAAPSDMPVAACGIQQGRH